MIAVPSRSDGASVCGHFRVHERRSSEAESTRAVGHSKLKNNKKFCYPVDVGLLRIVIDASQ